MNCINTYCSSPVGMPIHKWVSIWCPLVMNDSITVSTAMCLHLHPIVGDWTACIQDEIIPLSYKCDVNMKIMLRIHTGFLWETEPLLGGCVLLAPFTISPLAPCFFQFLTPCSFLTVFFAPFSFFCASCSFYIFCFAP